MSPHQIRNARARIAHELRAAGRSLDEIAAILRLPSKEEVRKLLGRAERLAREEAQ